MLNYVIIWLAWSVDRDVSQDVPSLWSVLSSCLFIVITAASFTSTNILSMQVTLLTLYPCDLPLSEERGVVNLLGMG
jgi:hypothetical protein